MEELKQIRYYSWNAELPPEHAGYWFDMSFIAKTIALLLENIEPKISRKDDAKYRRGTIAVVDYKEKFGEPKVYCRIASTDLVKDFYVNSGSTMAMTDMHDACFRNDVAHYRYVYLAVKKIWPQYWDAIYSGADHKEYLQNSQEDFLKYYTDGLAKKDVAIILDTLYRDK